MIDNKEFNIDITKKSQDISEYFKLLTKEIREYTKNYKKGTVLNNKATLNFCRQCLSNDNIAEIFKVNPVVQKRSPGSAGERLEEPPAKAPNLKYKYLKYKCKYLQLKKLLLNAQ